MELLPKVQGKTLTITLKDDEGKIIPGIDIKLLNHSKQILQTKSTNASGVVIFNIKPGNYYIRINKQTGYKVFADYPVTVDDDKDLDVVLELE